MSLLETARKAYAKLKAEHKDNPRACPMPFSEVAKNPVAAIRAREESEGCEESSAYRLVNDPNTLAEVANTIRSSQRIALDTETTGLDPHKDRVRLLQLATDNFVYIVDCFNLDPSPLWPALGGKELVFHNAHFDVLFLHPLGFDFSAVTIRDTMILSVLLTAGDFTQRNSLGALAERYLGYSLDKTHQKSNWDGELTPAKLEYAARDARATFDLYEPLTTAINAAGLWAVADLEHRCLPTVLWMSIAGIGFDKEAWLKLASKAEQEAELLRKELTALAPAKPRPDELRQMLIALGVKKPPKNPPKKPAKVKPADMVWNWSSNDQVKAAFHLLGIKLKSTDKEALAAVDHPLAVALRRYRAAAKLVGTYGRKWLDYICVDGRIRCSWKQTEAITGRMACEQPNMQNLPGDPGYRNSFKAPPGRVNIKGDYSQIELRLAAKIAADQKMIDAFRARADLHTLTAQQITSREEVTAKERKMAKPVNFGLIYGMSAPKLARKAKLEYETDMTKEQAEQYRKAWFQAWPGIARWHKELERQRYRQMLGREPPETRTLTGRRTIVPKDHWYGARANYIVQGSGGDGIKAALAILWERRVQCPHAFPILAVHDEIVIECDEDKAEQAEKWLKKAMIDAMAPLLDPVPCEVETKIGRTWGG